MSVRRRSRWKAGVAALGALTLVLGACAGDDGDTANGDGEAATEDDATEDDATEGGDTDEAEEEPGDAAAGEEFFAGKTVTLVVPFSPGGGYDSYARMIAPYLQEELGAGNVVVENEPGAGGLLAINRLTTDNSEGLRIAIMNAVGVAGATIAGAEGAAFGLDELSYIGRVGQESHLWVTGADSQHEDVEQVIEQGSFRFGSTGPGAADYVISNLLMEILRLENGEIITGFEGSSENELAVTRGDVDGMTGDFDSRIQAVEDGDHRALLVIGPEGDERVPDAPAIVDLELDDEQRDVVDALLNLLAMGRPLVASPNVPEAHLAALRAALERALANEELQQEAETTGRPLNYLSGEEMEEVVRSLMEAPPAFVSTLEAAY